MRSVIFKIQQFPHVTETFVLAQIITAINAGCKVSILVKEVLDFKESTHQMLLEKYHIKEKIIIEDYNIPKIKLLRTICAGFLILKHLKQLGLIKKYNGMKPKFSLSWIYEFNFFWRLKDIDIIHVQYGTNVHPVDILKEVGLVRAKLIVSFHGHDAFFPINGFIPNNGYYGHLFKENNLIIANTPYLARKIEKLGCKKKNIKIIPVGVDTNFFKPVLKKKYNDKLKFISVGRLDKIKGHHVAIDLIKKLLDSHHSVELTIIGDGFEKQNLIDKIKRLKLQDYVFLVGQKSQQEIRSYLRESDIYILTALPLEDGRRETQGLATLEAGACGLPVIAFDSGGIKYTILDGVTGFLCTEKDMDCLVKKSIKLMDSETRLTFGKNATEFVKENFSIEKIDEIWKEIYVFDRL